MENNISKAMSDVVSNAAMIIATKANAEGVWSIVVSTDGAWEFPLPENVSAEKYMRIDIAGWAQENVVFEPSGMYIRPAFGDQENSCVISFDDVMSIIDDKQNILWQRTFSKSIEENKTHTLSSVMQDHEAQQKSMSIMKKHNKGRFGLDEEDTD